MSIPDTIPQLLTTLSRTLRERRADWDREELNRAPRFQEFACFSQREEAVSKAIAALISPWASHGQGRTFLDLLLERIPSKALREANLRHVPVRSAVVEDATEDRRRIDIVVAFENGFQLGIESKVFNAPEQPSQIGDYVVELKKRGQFVLLCLQGAGGGCDSISQALQQELIGDGRMVALPAVKFLNEWLGACSASCRANRVSHFLEIFRNYIERPGDQDFMNSDGTNTHVVADILSSHENLDAAFAIHRHFHLAAHVLANKFLEHLHNLLQTHITAEKVPWEIRRFTRVWSKDAPSDEKLYPGIFTTPFGLNEWRYVEFSVKDLAWVVFEMGFKPKNGFEWLYATTGIRRYEAYPGLSERAPISKLNSETELALLKSLDVNAHPAFAFFSRKTPSDWHWQREIHEPLFPSTESSHQRLYASLNNPDDQTIADFADFMMTLGKKISAL